MKQWLRERTALGEAVDFLRNKTVPRHRYTFWYIFGGLTLFFFVIQAISGLLLTLYYSPTPETAHESVRMITDEVSFGWLVRSVHHWSAHLVVLMVLIHLSSKFFFQAYRKPREVTWISGILLLMLILGFAFTGYLLPWDTTGYFATQIGTEIPRSIPLVGPIIGDLLRGGEYIEATTLTRVFSLHVVIFPLISLLLIAFHLVQNQHTGSASPRGAEIRGGIPFYPDFLHRDILAWIGGLILLLCLVMLFPVTLGEKADIFSSPPVGIRPEWYFLPLFQTIRMLPGTIFGMSSELVVNLCVGGFAAAAFLLPWLHRDSSGPGVDRLVRVVGITVLAYIVVTVIMGFIV